MSRTATRHPADEDRAGMWARVGDRLIVGGSTVGDEGRDGEIIALHHADGTPPFDVRWSDTGRITLVFPGPAARVQHFPHSGRNVATPRP